MLMLLFGPYLYYYEASISSFAVVAYLPFTPAQHKYKP
jgi:hypothetical protein